MNRILIATDGSAAAEHAVETGLELAEEHAAHVTFLHVESRVDLYVGSYLTPPVGLEREETPPEADEVLRHAADLAADRGLEVTLLERVGYAADEIAAVADEIDADLVVVGSRGLGAISGFVLGSTSRALLRRTTRPLLVVRTTKAPVAAAPA